MRCWISTLWHWVVILDIKHRLYSDYGTCQSRVEGKEKKFTFIGFEREAEAIWIYLEYPDIKPPKNVEIENGGDEIDYKKEFFECRTKIESKSIEFNKLLSQLIFIIIIN